jgi:hypothetical protein
VHGEALSAAGQLDAGLEAFRETIEEFARYDI